MMFDENLEKIRIGLDLMTFLINIACGNSITYIFEFSNFLSVQPFDQRTKVLMKIS